MTLTDGPYDAERYNTTVRIVGHAAKTAVDADDAPVTIHPRELSDP